MLKLENLIFITNKRSKRGRVCGPTSRLGLPRTPIHGCDPTTAQRGDFCLLRFRPEPIRPSSADLDAPGSPRSGHVDAELSADTRSTWTINGGKPQPVNIPRTSLPEAGLQRLATAPGGTVVSLGSSPY